MPVWWAHGFKVLTCQRKINQPQHSLENFPDEMCQEHHQKQSADSANPEKEVGCQFWGIDFFFVHSKITSNADATLEWRIVREQ